MREMYDRGLQFLASKQTDKGEWTGGGYEDGPGPVGLGLLVFLASGEDPNFGQYSNHVRRSLRSSDRVAGRHHGHHRSEHVPSRLRDARSGRGLRRGG